MVGILPYFTCSFFKYFKLMTTLLLTLMDVNTVAVNGLHVTRNLSHVVV